MARRNKMTASMRISVEDPNALLRLRSSRQRKDWTRAWNYYDSVGEVHFALNEVGREMSRIRLVAQRRDADGVWQTVDGNDKVQGLVDDIGGYVGGQGQMLRSFYINQKVVGEAMLVIYEKEGRTWYDVCSPDEIDVTEANTGKPKLTRRMVPSPGAELSERSPIEELPASTDVIRIWTPHPRYSYVADSPLLALDVVLDELKVLTQSLMNKLKSRLAMGGFWFIPNSIQEIGVGLPQGDPTNPTNDVVLDKLVKAMTAGIQDMYGPGAAMPFLLRGPDDAGEKIRIEFPDRELFTAEIELRNELIERTLAGLDIHRQQAKGTQDSNHWSAWAGQETHLNNQVAPDMESFVVALNKDWLPRAEGVGENYRVWFTMDELTQRPNKAEDARQVADRGAISFKGLRVASGIPEEFAPETDDYVRQVGIITKNPYFALWKIPGIEDKDFEKAGITKPPGPTPGPGGEGRVGPGVGDPGSPGDNDSDTPKGERPGG